MVRKSNATGVIQNVTAMGSVYVTPHGRVNLGHWGIVLTYSNAQRSLVAHVERGGLRGERAVRFC